jgi:hypothetical protein
MLVIKRRMCRHDPQGLQVNKVIDIQRRSKETVQFRILIRKRDVQCVHLGLLRSNVCSRGLTLQTLAVGLRRATGGDPRPFCRTLCLLGPPDRGLMFSRCGTLTLLRNFRLMLNLRKEPTPTRHNNLLDRNSLKSREMPDAPLMQMKQVRLLRSSASSIDCQSESASISREKRPSRGAEPINPAGLIGEFIFRSDCCARKVVCHD